MQLVMQPQHHRFGMTPESFEIVARSPNLDVALVQCVVCVPTFRRPLMLERTLQSLAAQQGDLAFAVIVIENDAKDRLGAAMAAQFMTMGEINGLVIVEPAQGNCNAYNAGWRCALTQFPHARFICGIDDDEQANPQWLAQLIAGAQISGSGIVGGSVTPVFEDPKGERYRLHPIFRSHYSTSGNVPMIYSSANYLIRREVFEASPWPFLDVSFNFIGGGDTDFFTRAKARGIGFYWRQEASMMETMPPRRSEKSWIAARGYRNGMISTLIERKSDPSLKGNLRRIFRSIALLAMAPVRSMILGARTRSMTIGLYHCQVAIGRLMAEMGLSIEQYRAPEKN